MRRILSMKPPAVIQTDLFLNPYNSLSVHHKPIGTGAQYAGNSHPSTTSLLLENFTTLNVGIPWGRYIVREDPSLPLVTFSQHAGYGSGEGLPISLRVAYFYAPGPVDGNYYDNEVQVVSLDNSVHTFYEVVWLNSGSQPRANFRMSHSAEGKGHGPSRTSPGASGLGALIGIVRGHEVNADSGEFGHCINFLARSRGTNQVFSKQFVWPATSTDWFCSSPENCNGNIPYGALFALPQQIFTDSYINGMGLSELGRRIARQLRNYGGYFVDGAQGRPIRCDQYITSAKATEFRTQMKMIYPGLRMVTNNLESYSQAAGGGTPIAPNTAYDA